MSLDRRSFLLLAVGAGVIGACGSESGMDIMGLMPASRTTPETNVDTFMRHLTDGSKGFMQALAEMNSLLGRREQAKNLKAYLKGTPDTWDAETFKKASEMADKAALPADAKIMVSKVKGTSHVIGAWTFGTYAGFMNKETYEDAENVVKQKPIDPKVRDAIVTAEEALDILPSNIATGKSIVETTASFMSQKGIARPDTDEIEKIIREVIAEADLSDIKAAFG